MLGIVGYVVLMLLVSIVAGLVGSLVGIGGGIIVVPVLSLFFSLPVPYAIGASIVSVIATSSGSASAYVRDRITNLRIGMFLEIATASGAVLGAIVSLYLFKSGLDWVVFTVFGVVLVMSGVDLMRKNRPVTFDGEVQGRSALAQKLKLKGEYHDTAMGRTIRYEAVRVPFGLLVMLCAGVISGLLGIGSGALKVLGMDTMMKLPFKVSTTTSNFMIGVTAAASTSIFYIGGYVNALVAAPVALGVVAGSYVGTKILVRSRPNSLRLVFVVVLLVLGLEMIQRGLFQ